MNLADWLKRSRPVGEQIAMVAALAQAVEEGHSQGTQYAGWSPSRIQIRGDGGADLTALDASGDSKEDLAYTAPEAVDGNHTTRSDVYSAGVILYEILSGSHPFGGLSVKQPRGAPKPLGDVRRDLPKDLADAVTACLERDPEWRPADLSYVVRVSQEAGAKPARAAAAAPAASSRTGGTGRMPAAGGRRETAAVSTPRGGGGSSTRLPLILIAVVLVAGGGAAAYFMLGKPAAGGTAAATPPPPTTLAAAIPTETATVAATEAPTAVTPRPAATLPSLAARTPSPAPATAAPTTPPPTAAPTRVVVAAATAAPTATRTATAAPVVTAAPTAEPTQAPTAAPVVPASLKAVAPPKIKRGQQHLLDVRGENLRADLQARFQHKGRVAGELQVARQRVVDPALLQVLVVVGPNAQTGPYSLAMVDGAGNTTNAVLFEIIQ